MWQLHFFFLLAGATFLALRTLGESRIVEAEVLRFGIRADYDGNHPLVIVRLADGSTRQLQTSAAQLRECSRGSRIFLLQRGQSYRVALNGCPD